MTKSYIEAIEEAFKDPFNFNTEKMEAVVAETVEYLKDLKERFESDDPMVREKAKEMALEVQEGLAKQVEHLCKTTGLDMAQLTDLASTQVAADQQEQLAEADKKFEAIFSKNDVEPAAKPARFNRSKKINLVG